MKANKNVFETATLLIMYLLIVIFEGGIFSHILMIINDRRKYLFRINITQMTLTQSKIAKIHHFTY